MINNSINHYKKMIRIIWIDERKMSAFRANYRNLLKKVEKKSILV